MSSSLPDQYRYTISNIKLLKPPVTACWRRRKSIFLLKIAKITGGDNELLKSVEVSGKNQIVWSEQTLYGVTAESTINFKILVKKGRKNDFETIGEYTNTISGLLDIQISSGICKVAVGRKSQLSFTIKEDRFKDILHVAKQQSEGVYFSGGKSWSRFFTDFDIVKTAADSVSPLSLYAQQVWSIVSMVPNIPQMHVTQNSNVEELLHQLMDIYKYINKADHLPILRDTHGDKLKLLTDKTRDCADFIKSYTETDAAKNFMRGPSFDDRISEFKKSFEKIFKIIEQSLMIEIASNNIEVLGLLSDIPYADKVGLDHEKTCLPGTRQKLIREILEWVDKDTSERVLILSGQAGTGKSAIAHTIAEVLGDRLGSFFCFNRSNKGRVNFLFSTISRNLADRDVSWRRNLVQAIKTTAIRKSLDPVTQFDEMIIKPSVGTTKRMAIIIDALDESGDQRERKILLNLLFERSSELPANYRIIITSRPEDDIAQFYQSSNVCYKYMADVDYGDTLNDIRQFISLKLSNVAEILDTVDKNWSLLLAQKSQSLFIWVQMACDYILEGRKLEAAQRLRTVLSKSTSSLHDMYHQILDAQPESQSDDYLTLLKTCVGAIIVSRKPLSISVLQAFFGPICGDGKNVKDILKSLNSLFIGINESTADVRPIHTSLFDFFLNPEQKPGTPNRYYIDTSDQSSFTYACLRVMNEMLRFNICELETSHLRNRDIPDFDSRVAKAIPFHLSYACCFWAYHLEYSRLNPDLLGKLNDLMHNKLLYFFEVLSLLGEIEHGRFGMRILQIKTKEENSELAARAAEASQFAFEFGTMMMESTPHLYLSSLPYISNRSFISQQFLPQYPQLLSMDSGQPITLRSHLKDSISQRHPSGHPSAVAFSPQGRQIASGFDNGDLWVWDYVTGEMVSQVDPKEESTAVCNVVFSLNGELVYCCFRDGSVSTWEAKTDKVLYESNEGLAPENCDDCTISPDGRYIAFGDGQTLSFYERESRLKLFENSSEYPYGMMFSPSGNLFGFQSGDRVVCLWDTTQRQTFVPPMSITEHWSLETLNDNHVIARIYGSPNAWEVWDIRTGAMVRRFEQESRYEGTFTFSPNGEYLLRSEGNKRWIWNILIGEITKRYVEHSESDEDKITLTALSPDSKYIAFSTSTRSTMHVLAWDALAQEETEDLSEDYNPELKLFARRGRVWLKGQHLLWNLKVQNSEFSRGHGPGYLQVLDTTRMTGLRVDFQVHALLVEVSPEDNHWSIAYVDEASGDNSLCLWNIDEKEVFILDKSGGKITALAFSATGDRLINGDSMGNIKVWHVRTRSLISHSGLLEVVTALTISSMGTTFWVAYGTDEEPFIEERECSELLNIINGPFKHNSTNRSISLSSNNTYICVCAADARDEADSYYDILLLDRSTGARIGYFNMCQLPRFSSNRRYIAWIPEGDSKKVELWDLEKNIALDAEFPSDGEVMGFEFSNDSTRMCILGDVDKTEYHVDIWDIETNGLVMQSFFSKFRSGDTVALYGDSFLSVGTPETGKFWNLHVNEIMKRIYDDNLDNSRFDTLPGHLLTRRLIEDYKLRSEDTEALDYALVAWNKANFSPRTKSEDGWMLGPHGELLFWVPREMRSGLWYPSMSFTACEKFTKLNFDKFVHGTRWTECGKIKDSLILKIGNVTSNNDEDFKRLGDISSGQQDASTSDEVIPRNNSAPNEDDEINTEVDGDLRDGLVIRETSVEDMVPEIPPSPCKLSIDLVVDSDYDGSDVDSYDTTNSLDLPDGHSTHALSGESRSKSGDEI